MNSGRPAKAYQVFSSTVFLRDSTNRLTLLRYRICVGVASVRAASSSDPLRLKSGQMTAARSGADPRIDGAPWGRTPHKDEIPGLNVLGVVYL